MQEDTAAWPQPMWGLFRLGRDGPVRGDHGRKGGTAWISAPGKTWATNRNHAARAIPNSASPPPSHTKRLRNPTSSPATNNDPATAIQSEVSILPPYPLPSVAYWYPRPGTPPSIYTRRCRESSLRGVRSEKPLTSSGSDGSGVSLISSTLV